MSIILVRPASIHNATIIGKGRHTLKRYRKMLWEIKAIDALLYARVELKTIHKGKEMGVPIEERISEWLQEMELAHSFSILNEPGALETKRITMFASKSPNSAKVTLADMGYGLAEFLPVASSLLLCARRLNVNFRTTWYSSSSKRWQSQLADLLIEVITERNLQILVESHSEHSAKPIAAAYCGRKN